MTHTKTSKASWRTPFTTQLLTPHFHNPLLLRAIGRSGFFLIKGIGFLAEAIFGERLPSTVAVAAVVEQADYILMIERYDGLG